MLDNTYVMYVSDNGYHLGHHGLPKVRRRAYMYLHMCACVRMCVYACARVRAAHVAVMHRAPCTSACGLAPKAPHACVDAHARIVVEVCVHKVCVPCT